MPCNVVVRKDPDSPDRVIVDAMDPRLMVEVTREPGLDRIADEVRGLLQEALNEAANET